MLLVDEMQLKSRTEYDRGLQHIVGYVSSDTLPTDAATGTDKEPDTHQHSRSCSPDRSSRDLTTCPNYKRSSPPTCHHDHPVWAAFRKMLDVYEHR